MQAHLVDIINHEIFDAEITVSNGRIASVSRLDSPLPPSSPYVMPGFVDSHIHIESTLLTPRHFAQLAVRQGTVAVVTDPHEIANVCGLDGIEYMMDDAARSPLHINFGIPSCVPCTPFESNGAFLNADNTRHLLGRSDVVGLAEMMNAVATIHRGAETMAKINSALQAGKVVDGHAPGLRGDDAKSYIDAGITTDHEVDSLDIAVERISMGMKIMIREGSAARNFDALSPLLADDSNRGMLMFCTDDIYPDELQQGHINTMVRRAVRQCLPLWNVLHAACVAPVCHYHLPVGLLRQGDAADFILVDNLTDFNVLQTYVSGVKVFDSADGSASAGGASPLINTWGVDAVGEDDFAVVAQSCRVRVIGAHDGSLFTDALVADAKLDGRYAVSDTEHDVLKIAIVNRYRKALPSVAFVHGFGLRCGAMASSVAHDSHNIVVIGTNDGDMATAVNALCGAKGGICCACGTDIALLPLPVAGLMSNLDGDTVASSYKHLYQSAAALGCPLKAPYMTMAFMALPVIPHLKITDLMLFDSDAFQPTSLFV